MTLFIAAPTLRPLMKFLKLDKLSPEERAELERSRADFAASVVQEGAFSQAGQCLSGAFL